MPRKRRASLAEDLLLVAAVVLIVVAGVLVWATSTYQMKGQLATHSPVREPFNPTLMVVVALSLGGLSFALRVIRGSGR